MTSSSDVRKPVAANPPEREARPVSGSVPAPEPASPPSSPHVRQQRMIDLLKELAPSEGYTQSPLDSVRYMRANGPLGRTPVLYEPSIVIVCQGRKRGFFGDQVYVYDAQHYLVLSVPLPFSTETEATVDEPMLGIALRIDLAMLSDLLLTLEHADVAIAEAPRGMVATRLDDRLAAAALRLLEALHSPVETRVLGPAIVREIAYLVLMGEQGGALRAALTSQGQFGKVAKALRRIHADYASSLDVGQLAREAGMSGPAFHAHFKAVTHTSPIQYLKSTRLHQARLLMIRQGLTAAAASARVGYESPSQFSREFKRFFGRSPVEEAGYMKTLFALTPARSEGRYVMAH
jgi:AraC-like DNA-binding protein